MLSDIAIFIVNLSYYRFFCFFFVFLSKVSRPRTQHSDPVQCSNLGRVIQPVLPIRPAQLSQVDIAIFIVNLSYYRFFFFSFFYKLFPYFTVARFPRKDQTRADHSTAVLSPEDRAVISLNGETLQDHRRLVTDLKQQDQHQQTLERQRKENVAFVTKKVGYS